MTGLMFVALSVPNPNKKEAAVCPLVAEQPQQSELLGMYSNTCSDQLRLQYNESWAFVTILGRQKQVVLKSLSWNMIKDL